GFFPGNSITFTTRTNSQGQASGQYAPNGVAGRFNLRVTATAGDRFGDTLIPQTNATITPGAQDRPARQASLKKWLIIGGIGAAAAITVGVVLANRGSSPASTPTSNNPPVISVTPGPPVFGGPH